MGNNLDGIYFTNGANGNSVGADTGDDSTAQNTIGFNRNGILVGSDPGNDQSTAAGAGNAILARSISMAPPARNSRFASTPFRPWPIPGVRAFSFKKR